MMRTPPAPLARAVLAAISLVGLATEAVAQRQPETIPTIVAQATGWPGMFGVPEFFDGRLPTDWPAEFVPAGARVLGGSIVGEPPMIRMRTAVFELPPGVDLGDAARAVLARAGFVQPTIGPRSTRGGFVANVPSPAQTVPFCKDGNLATFAPVDSVRAPRVVALVLIDGAAGRENCDVQRERDVPFRMPVEVPPLSPPAGTQMVDAGSSWGNDAGSLRSSLRTTMPVDSVLAHYTTQLVAGGWRAEGSAALTENDALQRFYFRQRDEEWMALLIVSSADGPLDLRLELAKR